MSLFVALGGVSYGVATGSIDSREVKNNSLRGGDLRSSSITAREIRARSLDGTDIKINRVGGNAVKEEVLEVSKLPKVPSASLADAATAAGTANSLTEPGSSALKTRWALVNEDGAIEEQSGGFTVVSRPGINGQPAANPNIYLSAGSSLVGKGLSVSTAIQNRLDRNADGTADPAFNGDTAVGRCNTAAINCVPTGTNTDNTLVVRSLVDNTDVMTQTRRFYVEVTE